MKVIAHRGFWKDESEKNSLLSFKRAFEYGYGIETDIRDLSGELVISHNPPTGGNPLFGELIDLYKKAGVESQLALNIKADGLYILLDKDKRKYELEKMNYFFFDMSVPEQYMYVKGNYRVYTRSSEFEIEPVMLDKSSGIWLDQFNESGHILSQLPIFLEKKKNLVIISPELHGRPYLNLWKELKRYSDNDCISICTDIPEEARAYFE